jgi:class 3 adenylate cyclase/pimeloyl-ACP methyl ester carboxylesterase
MSVHWDNPAIARVLRRLANFSRFVTYDQQGLGYSDPIDPTNPPPFDDLVADLQSVIDAAEVTDPVLFGTHNGGAVAIAYATRHPVRKLIVCNTWARLEVADDFPIGVSTLDLDREQERHDTEWTQGKISARYVSGREGSSWRRHELATTSLSQAGPLFRMNRVYDVRHLLPAVTAQTLVIHTKDNRRIPAAHAEYIAASIPGARLAIIPGRDHFFLKNCGTEVVDQVEEFVTGTRTAFADQIRAAVLFTDIVDSTLLAGAIGDQRWASMLDEHNAEMERLVGSHLGEKCKHTGDGFLALFADASDAVRCALAAVAAIAPLGLEIRAGVHVGLVTRMDESDLSGVDVHFARRICEQAGAGQVLVSDGVRGECEGRGLAFEERGRASLKGFQGDWELCEARFRERMLDDDGASEGP